MSRFAWAACAIAGVIFTTLALAPVRYAAIARVLLPQAYGDIGPFVVKAAVLDMSVSGEPGSRILSIEHWDADPQEAAAAVNAFLRDRLPADLTVVDQAAVPYRPIGPGKAMRLVYGVLAVLFFTAMFFRRRAQPRSDRPLVRHALRFARSGEKTVLVEANGRLMLSRNAFSESANPEYRILATLLGGALIIARQESRAVAVARRRSAGTVVNS